jgi:perosamine synthetase
MKSRIPYTRPSITEAEVRAATGAARDGWGERCYEDLQRFERGFAAHLGVRYAIATSSCTGAIHLGLAAMGIRDGDEVILADTNWIASAAPIMHMRARPVFVDIDPDSWCIDPAAAERAITPRTKAIVAVHLYGNLCEMDALRAIGTRHGLPIIEDAAEAIGSSWHGHAAGSMGRFGTFSFHGTKTITTGEGGMLVTNDDQLAEIAATLSNHGRARGQVKQFWPDMLGFKFKMSNVQAAIGCAQLARIEELVARKRAILDGYRHRLSGVDGIALNPEPDGTVNGAWMPTAVFAPSTGVTRERLLGAFAAENIDARVFFHPLSSLPMFTPCRHNRNAWDIPGRAINLPSFHDITDDELDRVAAVLRNCLHG